MSLSHSIRIPIPWPDVHAFTFGKSALYGYDSVNHCLLVSSLTQLNNENDFPKEECLYLSSSPTWAIKRLVLNEDESTLALLAEHLIYLADLSKSSVHTAKGSPSKGWNQCLIVRVAPLTSSPTIVSSIIDFVWLDTCHFAVVYTVPSASECHIYGIQSSGLNELKLIETFSVGSSPTHKIGTPSKKISLHQPSDIVKLDTTKRRYKDSESILLFALKTDGDMFVLELELDQLSASERWSSAKFQGPILVLPSTTDNYGSNYEESTFLCVSNIDYPTLVLTRDRNQLNQCIILSPSPNKYYMFIVDSVCLPEKETQEIITSMARDGFSSNSYYICDTASNVYLIHLSWMDKIQKQLIQPTSTHIQHLINGTNVNHKAPFNIKQMDTIEIPEHGQYLATVAVSKVDKTKELVLVRLKSSEITDKLQSSSDSPLQFVNHVCSLLARDQSLPRVTLSTTPINISEVDFEKNLLEVIKILKEQYIAKQDRVQREIQNKRNHLEVYQETQRREYSELDMNSRRIQKKYSILREKYEQELLRRKRLISNLNDTLSVIEQETPVISQAEKRLLKQLEDYTVQITSMRSEIQNIQNVLLPRQDRNVFDDSSSLDNDRHLIQNYRTQINQMQQRIQAFEIDD